MAVIQTRVKKVSSMSSRVRTDDLGCEREAREMELELEVGKHPVQHEIVLVWVFGSEGLLFCTGCNLQHS